MVAKEIAEGETTHISKGRRRNSRIQSVEDFTIQITDLEGVSTTR
jgi:hypothetical protein